MPNSKTGFIPDKKSRLFTAIFDPFVRFLFRLRLKQVWIDQNYFPEGSRKTIYFLNHTSWWDGLIPLLLNRKLFRQDARAMMEDKQMKKYRFFKWLGAFSVNLKDASAALPSLRYAVKSLQSPGTALYIYPEGKIEPFTTRPEFQKGLGWISNQCPDADVVPVGICFSTAASSKPQLFIKIGKPVAADHSLDSNTLNEIFEKEMNRLLESLLDQVNANSTSFLVL